MIMTTKIAIIGAGGMASYHVKGFRQTAAEVVGITDINPEAARRAAKKFNIPRVYDGVDELLAAAEVDAVSVIVPNKFHAPLSIQALQAGKHVFCEKPPALNAEETKRMQAAAEKAGRLLMFNFNNRARPESFKMMELIHSGAAGSINSAQARWIRRTGIPGFGGWFTTKALSGGGPLIDLLHMLDLALYFMNYPRPTYVLAQAFDTFITNKEFKGPWGIPDVAGGVTDVEAAVHGFVRFETGQVVSLQNSWAEMVRTEVASVEFQGTKGGGRVERVFKLGGTDETATDVCEFYRQQHGLPVNETLAVEPCEDMGRVRSAANFVLALEAKEPPLNTVDQAVSLMTIIDAIYASARTGQPVKC
jgi:predicted dehydrogenase